MGSFNATCIVSNLPIEAGTPVRFLALARNAFSPDGNGHECYVTGRWQLHGVPIKGQCNDYGSVERIEQSFTTRVFFEGLALSAVEIGVGDNSCHDPAVRTDMDQDSWLNALWEGRVKVDDSRAQNRRYKEAKELDQKLEELTGKPSRLAAIYTPDLYKPAQGVPTFQRIEKLLTDAGLKLSAGNFDPGLLIDDVGTGFVRIRRCELGVQEGLESILSVLHGGGYAAMLTAGSGSYSNKAEVLVAPLPSTDPNVFIRTQHEVEDYWREPRPVSQAMIREDVWQILLNTPIKSWVGSYNIDSFRESAVAALDKELAIREELKVLVAKGDESGLFRLSLKRSDDVSPRENIFAASLRGSEGVSGFSFREAFRFAIDTSTSPDDLRDYVRNLAETIYVQWAYSNIHGQWHPTSNSGQEGNWKEHRAFLTELLKIKGRWEEDEDDSADDEEDTNQ